MPRWMLLLLLLLGCNGRDQLDDDDMMMMTTGTVAKGESCVTDDQCAEPDAVCRKGNVCTGTLGADAFQQECDRGGGGACPGLACLGLRDNVQGKTGICTMGCDADADCGASAACVDISGNRVCLTTCTSNAGCLNGYVCTMDPAGRGQSCFVEPI